VGGLGNKGRKGPLDMLERSHRRLEENLNQLRAAAEAIAGGPATDADRATVCEVVEFFERSVTRHEADEEQSLFPRLRERGAIDPVLDTLVDEHREHNRLHRRLREITDTWRDRPPTLDSAQHLLRLVVEIQDAYARHLELEERQLFPAARELSTRALAEAADEMQARRGRA
jgi:iron-sulfur cluster repair protein YtfE (RIC family)